MKGSQLDIIQSKELIEALDFLIFLDCFLSVLAALFIYDAAYFLVHRLSVYLRLSRKKGGPL